MSRTSLALTLLILTSLAPAQDAVSHPFICSDNGQGKVFVIDAEGQTTWEYDLANSQDVWLLPNGNYLLSYNRGAIEITVDKEIVWQYESPEGTEVHTCQPLPDGRVMVIECGSKRIVEIDPDGEIAKTVRLHPNHDNVHGHFRNGRKLANGNYLVSFVGENKLVEVDGDGHVVKEFPTPGNVFGGIRLPNGNTLAGCGDGHKIVEFDPEGNIVWQIDENDLPGNPLRFVAGLQRLPNGNTVVCNWGGHGHIDGQPVIFEVTRDKQVVWQIDDYERFQCVSNVMLLDIPGDATQGEILR